MSEITLTSAPAAFPPGTSDLEIEAAGRKAASDYKRGVLIRRFGILFILLGAWEGAARSGLIDAFFYSYPDRDRGSAMGTGS